jgi:ABC-type multidrug transport system ATPase subunit
MEEVERLADRILIIKDGACVAYGTKDELKKKYKMKTIEDIFVSIYTGREEA